MASVVTNPNKLKLVELNRTKYSNNRKLVNSVRKIFKFCQHNGQACIKEPALTLAASIGWGSLELETKKLESVDILESWWYAWCCYFCWSPHWLLPLTRTVGQKVIKLKIYIAFSFRRDTFKWPFGPFCLKERHGVYVPAKYFILRPVRFVLSTLNERVFVSRANLIIMPLKGDLKSKVSIYTIANVMTLKYWW